MISSLASTMAAFAQIPLSAGWFFKDSDDRSEDAWLSVPQVPSVVQQDLIANNKYGPIWRRP